MLPRRPTQPQLAGQVITIIAAVTAARTVARASSRGLWARRPAAAITRAAETPSQAWVCVARSAAISTNASAERWRARPVRSADCVSGVDDTDHHEDGDHEGEQRDRGWDEARWADRRERLLEAHRAFVGLPAAGAGHRHHTAQGGPRGRSQEAGPPPREEG